MSTEGNSAICRLCGGTANIKFSLTILNKYNTPYLACGDCSSLQTISPFWLEETYCSGLPNLDTGAARRATRTCSIILLASAIFNIKRNSRLLDFGGGDGLVCRLLRDIGFDAYAYDKYVENFYADGFSSDPAESYDIVSAIELVEHLAEPRNEIDLIFSRRPQMVILSTEIYDGQGPDWPYIGADHGGHVFFYSRRALETIASKYNYDVFIDNSTAIFFHKRIDWRHKLALRMALSSFGIFIGKIWMLMIRPKRS